MDRVVRPGLRTGKVNIPASKSQVHRLLICAALSGRSTTIRLDGFSKDIVATADCLRALGASITVTEEEISVQPVQPASGLCELRCGESGSTLRFMLPVVGALGADAVFVMEGRLPQRPLAPFDEELCSHGMELRKEGDRLYCSGKLHSGRFTLPGNVSSQYISGLLMALSHVEGDSELEITGPLESSAYITMTEDALRLSGIRFTKEGNSYHIPGGQTGALPEVCNAEGDWSNAAFFLCMGALCEEGISVGGLAFDSSQGDKGVLDVLRAFGASIEKDGDRIVARKSGKLQGTVIDAGPIPDLIPTLSVVASVAEGETRVIHAERLRLKESDRLQTTADMLSRLGAEITETEDGLIIHGKPALQGGTISAFGDHRIAMAAAVASCVCQEEVTVQGSESTAKSYPRFWAHLDALSFCSGEVQV